MGCYDSFIVEAMVCPRCGKTIRQVDFQTKDLFNALNVYYLGDSVATNADRIKVLANCEECTETVEDPFQVCYTFIEGYAILDKGVFVRLEVLDYKHMIPLKNQVVAQLNNQNKTEGKQ